MRTAETITVKPQNETKTGKFPAKYFRICKILKGSTVSYGHYRHDTVQCRWAVQTPHAQQMVTVTLILKLPEASAKSRATLASKTRQSLDATADATPSCTLRGVASHVRRRFMPFSSSLPKTSDNSSLAFIHNETPTTKSLKFHLAEYVPALMFLFGWPTFPVLLEVRPLHVSKSFGHFCSRSCQLPESANHAVSKHWRLWHSLRYSIHNCLISPTVISPVPWICV